MTRERIRSSSASRPPGASPGIEGTDRFPRRSVLENPPSRWASAVHGKAIRKDPSLPAERPEADSVHARSSSPGGDHARARRCHSHGVPAAAPADSPTRSRGPRFPSDASCTWRCPQIQNRISPFWDHAPTAAHDRPSPLPVIRGLNESPECRATIVRSSSRPLARTSKLPQPALRASHQQLGIAPGGTAWGIYYVRIAGICTFVTERDDGYCCGGCAFNFAEGSRTRITAVRADVYSVPARPAI